MRIPIVVALLLAICWLMGCQSSQVQLPTAHYSPKRSEIQVPVVDRPEVAQENGSIAEYVELGLTRNPRIQAAYFRVQAAKQRVPQAFALPDPTVNTNTYIAPVQTAAGEQAFALGVSQKLTNAQRRATQAAVFQEEVAAANAELEDIRLAVGEQIRNACYQLLLIRESIDITSQDAESLQQIAAVIERRYEVQASVSQQDVINVQVEQSKVENQLTELRRQAKIVQARLAQLLDVAPNSQLNITDVLATATTAFDAQALIEQALAGRPDLMSQLARWRRDQRKVQLAQLQQRPDFTVGLNWIATADQGISPVANGDDALILGIGFNLPIYQDRIRAAVCEAQANSHASRSEFAGLQSEVAEEVFSLVAKIESAQQTLTLIEDDILPKSERTLELSIDDYSTGKADFVQLIANWRNVLGYRIALANLRATVGQHIASLSRAVGQLEPLSVQSETVVEASPERPTLPSDSLDTIEESGQRFQDNPSG